MNKVYNVGGWTFRKKRRPYSRYSKLRLMPFSFCKQVFRITYGRIKHNLACATLENGGFTQIDVGTGLFLNNNQLLGVAVQVTIGQYKYTICALLHNDEKIIQDFINHPPEPPRSRDEGRDKGKGKGKAPAEASNVYFEPAGGAGTPCLPDTNPQNPGYIDAYGKGKMDRHDPNINPHIHPMGTYHQDDAGAYDPGLLAAWNQEEMGAYADIHVGPWNQDPIGPYNPNPMCSYHQDDTAAYDSSLLATWNQEQINYGQGQMDSHHQSEIDFHQPSYMNPQSATNIDDLTEIFQSPKLIKTRANQSPRCDRVHDGSRTARRDRSVYQNLDVQEPRPILDTSRINRKKPSRNPRTRSEHPEK